jgi:adenosine deaminase
VTIRPLDEVPTDALVVSLPKADLHLHQEEVTRLERIVARRQGRPAHDWRASARRLMAGTPPGEGRLAAMYGPDAGLNLGGVRADAPEYVVAKMVDALEQSAMDGAVLVEMRVGAGGLALMRPDFLALFREAERQVQARYPRLNAEAIGYLNLVDDRARLHTTEQQLERCLRAAGEGLAGVDFRVDPYDTEADPALWAIAYGMAERAAGVGLGITVHAGEFSAANLAAALRVPGLRRLGHAVYAATDARLLEQLAQSGVTVECSLSCNVVLGAVPSYEDHPIRQFVTSGIPVTLSTDNPVRIWTTIGREYAISAALGFSTTELMAFTRNGIRTSFTSAGRRQALMDEVDRWEEGAHAPAPGADGPSPGQRWVSQKKENPFCGII